MKPIISIPISWRVLCWRWPGWRGLGWWARAGYAGQTDMGFRVGSGWPASRPGLGLGQTERVRGRMRLAVRVWA